MLVLLLGSQSLRRCGGGGGGSGGGGGGGGGAFGRHEKGFLKNLKKVESRTITRARIIPVTIPAPGLSQRVYRPL